MEAVSRRSSAPLDGPSPALLARLASVLPSQALLVGDAVDPRYREDMRKRPGARPLFVLRPGSTEEAARCLAACDAFGQPLAIQGGRTGLAGAHRVREGEAVLSTERLTALGEVEPDAATILASAGTPLQSVQERAAAAGLLVGVDLGARGTATVGGNIATNAGGIRVLRYGMFRAQVAGLEAVLADGTVLSSLRGLPKDNTGYDLGQLFVGAEGTLGFVTRARLRLHPRPLAEANAFLAVPSTEAALALLRRLRQALGTALSAVELMLPPICEGVLGFLGMAHPLESRAPAYVLAEAQSFHDAHAMEIFSDVLMRSLEDGLVLDATLSQSPREFAALWTLRDSCSDYLRTLDQVASADISVPVPRIPDFLETSRAALRALDPATEFLVFGHLGDGNLHYVVRTPRGPEALGVLYRLAAESGGSVSAEHGIGSDKTSWLPLVRSEAEIATMRRLKRALDPNGILNPGRIFEA